MIRQGDEIAQNAVLRNFQRLCWKRAYEFYSQQAPIGVSIEDLYQEGMLGFFEALYTFSDSRDVGFAYYVNLCVVSSIKTFLRKCRGKGYRLLDTKRSLDMCISEDTSTPLVECIECPRIDNDPKIRYYYDEAYKLKEKALIDLSASERSIYECQETGYTYQEIASTFQLTTKQVDNVIQKVRRRLHHLRQKDSSGMI